MRRDLHGQPQVANENGHPFSEVAAKKRPIDPVSGRRTQNPILEGPIPGSVAFEHSGRIAEVMAVSSSGRIDDYPEGRSIPVDLKLAQPEQVLVRVLESAGQRIDSANTPENAPERSCRQASRFSYGSCPRSVGACIDPVERIEVEEQLGLGRTVSFPNLRHDEACELNIRICLYSADREGPQQPYHLDHWCLPYWSQQA